MRADRLLISLFGRNHIRLFLPFRLFDIYQSDTQCLELYEIW